MKEFQNRRNKSNFFYSRYMILILVVLIGLLAHATYKAYQKYSFSSRALEISDADLEKLQARNDTLERKITDLDTIEGKEKQARERFEMVKDGEKMIVLIDDNGPETPQVPKKSWWQSLLDIFY